MGSRSHTAAALAERFGLALRGDGDAVVDSVGTLANAGPRQLSFLANPRYRRQLAGSAAGVVVVREDEAAEPGRTLLLAPDPYVAFAKIAPLFDPPPVASPGVHPTAVVDASAEIDPSAEVGPLAVVGARTRVDAGAIIGPGCVIGEDCVVGAGSRLVARVTLVRRVRLGERVLVHPGAVLGADGFGLAMDAGRWIKVPQQGGVAVGDDCEIGANTTIDRGAIEDTVLEEDVRLDNQIQVAHNVRIGAHTAMAGCVAVAGSTVIGRNCLVGGAAGIVGHITICDRVVIQAMSLVTHSIDEPGEYSSGTPLMDARSWRRSAARFRQLDALARQVQALGKEKK